MGIEKRQYIRHPSDVPMLYELVGHDPAPYKQMLHNISEGGVCFQSNRELVPGQALRIQIDLVRPTFNANAVVVWCRPNADQFMVGVQFLDASAGLRARIVEQICHIEQYKRDVLNTEGRTLSGEEAAREWIEHFAEDFPRP